MNNFLKAIISELSNISWLPTKQLPKITLEVILTSIVFAAFLCLTQWEIQQGLEILLAI